ncbi:MAG: ABC transporter substrate-binding protein [Chthoniobacteraceae bacterium]
MPSLLRASLFVFLVWGLCGAARAAETVVRFGHFPNITHVQALVAQHLSRQGKGWFEERAGVKVEWYIYNAGPSAMEAVFANSIDITYVGPSPAINAFAKSNGAEVRIVSGAANGGAALVVQPGLGIAKGADFRGKRIATPQLGNTQDVACRAWLTAQGLKITQLGGDAQVIPTPNPDQLSLFVQKKIDAAWTVEPWVSRLERDAGGKVFLEEKDAVTTVLVSSVKFLNEKRDLLRKITAAHRELTQWIKDHPEEAQAMAVEELYAETRSKIAPELVASSWKRIELTNDVSMASLNTYVANAQSAGFLKKVPDLKELVVTP